MHDFPKNVSISQRRSLRVMQLIRLLLCDFLPETAAGVYGIELESKGPPFRIFIVVLKDVDSSEVDPLIHWFLDGADVHEGEKGGFSCSEVALD